MSSGLLVAAAILGGSASLTGVSLPHRQRVTAVNLLVIAASICAFIAAVDVLRSGRDVVLHSSQLIPLTGLTLVLDPLGALFVAITAAVAVATALFGIGYAHHGLSSRTSSGTLPLFITALLFVPAAGSVSTFLILWELMAISSLLLLLTEHRRRAECREAAQWYAVMTQLGAAAILAALVLLAAESGGQSFAVIHAHGAALSPTVRAVAFLLALLGFGSKAGAVPFHVWLPRAHPEAPSPVSALMSAAMVNLGIYGIIRVADGLLGGGPPWWWVLVLVLGVLSALYGALQATTSTDLKRLLAYSTTDNMGLVLLGVGASGLLATTGHETASVVAMVAALLHLLNHAAFKGALFLSAGSVQVAARTRNLDMLGGLMRRMPITGAIFVVGALAIVALPPLNGFVGEWLLFQSFLHGLPSSSTWVTIAMPIGVATLALTGGLTAAAFVKALGIGFLGQPRSTEANEAQEVHRSMWAGAGLLALLCVALGLAPFVVLGAVLRAANTVLTTGDSRALEHGWRIGLSGVPGDLAPALLAAGLVGALVATAGARNFLGRRRVVRQAEAWGCGRTIQTARMEYTATSFAEPLQRVFDDVLRPNLDLEVTHVAESRYYVESMAVQVKVDDAVERRLYRPLIGGLRWWGELARRVPNGSIHRYLAFGLVALIVVLVVVR